MKLSNGGVVSVSQMDLEYQLKRHSLLWSKFFRRKSDIMNCGNYICKKLLEHGMKLVKMMLENMLCRSHC